MLRYFIFIEYGLLPDLRVGVLISASQIPKKVKEVLRQLHDGAESEDENERD